jgi:hypothetical protein
MFCRLTAADRVAKKEFEEFKELQELKEETQRVESANQEALGRRPTI